MAGLGYIGAQLASDLLRQGERVVGLENFFSTDAAAVRALAARPGFTLVRGSITSPRSLARAYATADIATAYLLAAQSSAHPQAASPRYTEFANLLGPRLFAESARAHGVRSLVYASSLRVYGDIPPWQARENDCYGRFADLSHLSKIYAEKLLEMYATQSGPRARAVRLGLVYGVGPVMKTDPRFLTAPNKFCLQAVRGETIVVSEGGLRPQGLLHVADAAQALRLAASLPESTPYLAVNAAAEVATMLSVARAVESSARKRGLDVRVTARGESAAPGDGGAAVPSRLVEAGFRPRRALAESMDETLAYFLARDVRP